MELKKQEGTYLPDFTAYIATETVRCIQISRPAYDAFINKHVKEGSPATRPTMVLPLSFLLLFIFFYVDSFDFFFFFEIKT
jgi:hypothetical protein